MPEDDVFDAVERLHAELDEVRALLTGPEASVRLVLTPEKVVLAEARRSLHDAVALRLPRGRRRRQPGLPRRRRRRRGGPAGWPRRPRCWPRWPSPSPASRCGARSTGPPSRSGCEALADLAPGAVRRRRPARRPAGGAGRSGSPGPAAAPCSRLALPLVDPGRRRPRAQRRRAGRDRGVVSSSPDPARRAGPAPGRRCPRGARGSCR